MSDSRWAPCHIQWPSLWRSLAPTQKPPLPRSSAVSPPMALRSIDDMSVDCAAAFGTVASVPPCARQSALASDQVRGVETKV